MNQPLLAVDNLRTVFNTAAGELPAVGGISLTLNENESLGIVGESGSGKTVLARTIMGIQPRVNTTVTGSVMLDGHQMVGATDDEKRTLWGTSVSMIFQDPMTSLNPVMRVGYQIDEVLRLRLGMNKQEAKARSIELLAQVGITSPELRYEAYPHELSGGMRQRVVIAIALAGSPKLLLADEPTTGLDVTIQAQILNLIDEERAKMNMSVIYITHDLGVVATRTQKIIVMYGGRIVESGSTRDIFRHTRMPYTRALLDSSPKIANPAHTRLPAIPGRPPNLVKMTTGCAFAPRCSFATEQCRTDRPELRASDEPGHEFACWNPLPATKSE